ncbi:hypothetical protein B0I72DRAFT_136885 [Yarrowia lipolytica]|jgi:hypothetical protein|uniref:YALI0B13948p n=2 Tax=Yarrowia lipolytica TaxID=4952 RepID=Q6CEQ1_YARLI|nr:YALI0B13948p [Yarrowia lipolytica CLIB122]AOW01671.1 hypothetical protein YALI1_B18472g [Yarrowia lipolytica]KAB8284913.1 hypothetical protein BKA91DRAFT_134059 [Yarrowia lipolytica]KAE8175161.1 hypothetical protein BKA90DRAFT_132960 [Yarrowia lipolytica]KAJ8052473.1 hypothetical protein LXG23DRAFT_51960 [Yarrowia lipolytica]QNP97156.1 Hypothetical protein YALI2_C00809g [Yarrowia lipolytica]|eukprot:XP_500861.2 YALI0B13948p [Yarrowia lipolytica CLIB122]
MTFLNVLYYVLLAAIMIGTGYFYYLWFTETNDQTEKIIRAALGVFDIAIWYILGISTSFKILTQMILACFLVVLAGLKIYINPRVGGALLAGSLLFVAAVWFGFRRDGREARDDLNDGQ